MDEKTLMEIEARAAGASPGPWRVELKPDDGRHVRAEYVWGPSVNIDHCWGDDPYRQRWSRDRAFIVHAREDIPALLAEVRRLRAAPGIVEALEALADDEYIDAINSASRCNNCGTRHLPCCCARDE